jgi:diguanylate cyclase (GGDEF)-like protein
MFLDLDRFKIINDTLGHNVGDQLLTHVANRLTTVLRDGDTIARMGGDEFTIILCDLDTTDEAAAIAGRVLDAFTGPVSLNGREMFISTSIGISIYPQDGSDVETLVRNADSAMYRAKELGRNTYQFYSASMDAESAARIALDSGLRKALEQKEFVTHYQARVDLNSGKVLGAEALVRWQHPEHGLIPPAKFIQLAEDTGLIVPLTEWVIHTACSQNKVWQEAGLLPMDITVNISTRSFQQGDLIKIVQEALSQNSLEPKYLKLELTESTLMHNPDVAVSTLEKLKAMGVKIMIDDFGTGQSSLSYLKRFPVDAVKIDQSFVKDITTNPDNAAIAGAIIAMAHSLKLKVIAEGVETLEQLEFLRSLNCDEMQGYFVSRPAPVDEFTHLLWEARRSDSHGILRVA